MKKVLIVIDMQNDFVKQTLNSNESLAIISNVVEKVKNFDGEVFFTRDTHHDNYFATLEGEKLPVLHCVKNTDGWQIIDELLPYIKHRYNVINKYTFGYKDWNLIFDTEYTEFELCGVCTDICVVSNALALRMFYPNAKITVDASCCAGVTPEKHAAALEVMKSCQIEVINE